MKKGFFVTEMQRLDYQGSAIANVIFADNKVKEEYLKVQENHKEYDWTEGTLDALYDLKTEPDFIVLSSIANAYKNAVKGKFPSSKVEESK